MSNFSDDGDLEICGSCGSSLLEEDKFCGSCGLPRSNSEEDQEVTLTAVGVKKNNKTLKWGIGVGLFLIVSIIVGSNNRSENAAFLANVNSSGTDSSNSSTPPPQDVPSSDSTPMPTLSPKATKTAAPKIDNCAISKVTVSDLLKFRKLLTSIPTGKNDASHTKIILSWADSANNVASSLVSDASNDHGSVTSVMAKAATDLSNIAGLAADWANNNLSDAASFGSDYASAASQAQSDYQKISSICGAKLPGL